MGVHIHIERVKNIKEHDFENVDKEIGFDCLRLAGDKEFASSVLFESIHCGNQYCCDYFMDRPKDFNETRQWIKNNIPKCNQQRLLNVLDIMEIDEELYFYFSW